MVRAGGRQRCSSGSEPVEDGCLGVHEHQLGERGARPLGEGRQRLDEVDATEVLRDDHVVAVPEVRFRHGHRQPPRDQPRLLELLPAAQ